MATGITAPTITINGITVPIAPNTFTFTEGKGEQSLEVQSSGGGTVESVYMDNAESKLSKVTFSMKNPAENIDLIRSWKSNLNNNSISAVAEGFTRTFNNAALTSDYEVNLGSGVQIDLEFMSDAAV